MYLYHNGIMDVSFEINNSEGDQIMVALSYYDSETVRIFTSDPLTLTLVFYDVTLIRKAGEGYVGSRVLFAISDILARFMSDNEDAVLCFYCDAATDVLRNHPDMLPQEYRSRLFSRVFDMYVKSHRLTGYINHCVEIDAPQNPANRQFAHFICREAHLPAVRALGEMLMHK